MINFKSKWESIQDGLEDIKGVEYDMNGNFVDADREPITVFGSNNISELNAWFTEDYREFLKMNHDFMELDEEVADDIVHDVPEFSDYN